MLFRELKIHVYLLRQKSKQDATQRENATKASLVSDDWNTSISDQYTDCYNEFWYCYQNFFQINWVLKNIFWRWLWKISPKKIKSLFSWLRGILFPHVGSLVEIFQRTCVLWTWPCTIDLDSLFFFSVG